MRLIRAQENGTKTIRNEYKVWKEDEEKAL